MNVYYIHKIFKGKRDFHLPGTVTSVTPHPYREPDWAGITTVRVKLFTSWSDSGVLRWSSKNCCTCALSRIPGYQWGSPLSSLNLNDLRKDKCYDPRHRYARRTLCCDHLPMSSLHCSIPWNAKWARLCHYRYTKCIQHTGSEYTGHNKHTRGWQGWPCSRHWTCTNHCHLGLMMTPRLLAVKDQR